MKWKRNYKSESNKLIKAIDIAIETLKKFPTKYTASIIESYNNSVN
jgi:hypothetical protein